MAESSLGSLVVSLTAETAKFTDALEKAAYQMNHQMGAMVASAHQLERAMLQLDGVVGTFGTSLRGLFGVVAVGGLGKLVTSAIESQAELGRLAERAGTTTEQLSSMRYSAHAGGVAMDEVALASTRLSKAIFEAQDRSTKAGQALELLGLKAKDLVQLPTAQALETVAVALDKFKDSTGKTAVEMEIFGKSGPKMGAFLRDYAERGTVAASVTTRMSDAARVTEAAFFKLADTFSSVQIAAVNQLLPALNGIAGAFAEMQRTGNQTLGFWTALGEAMRIAALSLATLWITVRNVTVDLVAFGKAVLLEFSAGYADNVKKIFEERNKAIKDNTDSLLVFYNALAKGSPALNAFANITGSGGPTQFDLTIGPPVPERGKGNIGSLPVAGSADDPRKAALEAQIAALNKFIAEEKALLTARDDFLKFDYAHGYETESNYFAKRVDLMRQASYVEEDALKKQIELSNAYIAVLGNKKGAEKLTEEEHKRQAEIEGKLMLLYIDRFKQEEMLTREATAAKQAYRNALAGINEQLLLLQNNESAAMAIRLASSQEDQRRRLQSDISKGTPAESAAAALALQQLNEVTRLTQARADLNTVSYNYNLILSQIGMNPNLIALQFQAGNITELQAYAQKANAARELIPLLSSTAAAYEAIAKASGNPGFLIAAQQLRLEIAKLAVDADALAKKFTDIFSGSFSTFLTSVVDGTKSLSQAFRDMARNIEQSISQIAAKNLAEQLFDKAGPLGGLGAMFAKGFGDTGAGGAGANVALASLGTSATTGSAALLGFTSALTTASAAALSFSASAGAGGIGSAFFGGGGLGSILGPGGLFGFAEGTPFVPRDMLAIVHRGEKIIPAAQNKPGATGAGGNVIHVTVNVPQSTSRATADQIGAETGAAIQRSMRKYG